MEVQTSVNPARNAEAITVDCVKQRASSLTHGRANGASEDVFDLGQEEPETPLRDLAMFFIIWPITMAMTSLGRK
jgi:hypothetical protein